MFLSRRANIVAMMLLYSSHCKYSCDAYITTGLPLQTHTRWLEKLTVDICESSPGYMTEEMVESTPMLMSAWAQNPYDSKKKKKYVNSSHGMECAMAVERLLKRMVDERMAGNQRVVPNTLLYNAALQGWAMAAADREGGAAAQRAEQILMQMESSFESGEDLNVRPNTKSFYAVMLGWSKSGETYSSERALQVLDWMINLNEHNNDKAIPDMNCFSLLLNMLAKKGDGEECEKLFTIMERIHEKYNTNSNDENAKAEGMKVDVRPRTEHFNLLLEAWRKSDHEDAPQRAQDVLQHMEQLTDEGITEVAPNLLTYTKVVQTVSKCKHSRYRSGPARATFILKQMVEKYETTQDESLAPDSHIYNAVLDSWAKSGYHEAAFKANRLLDDMIKYSVKNKKVAPDVYSYTDVISACARTTTSAKKKSKRKIYGIAMDAFNGMTVRDDGNNNSSVRDASFAPVSPSHVTYGTILNACANLLPQGRERQDTVRDIFTRCQADGQVGDMVVTRLRHACASATLYQELMNGHTRDSLPEDWTRHVREKKSYNNNSSVGQSNHKSTTFHNAGAKSKRALTP